MLFEILRHTPLWVWVLLALLLVLGATQWRDRAVTRLRLVILPLVLLALGISTLMPALRHMPAAVLIWLAGGALAFAGAARWRVPARARWHAGTQRLHVPGSAWPMVLILATFLLKYSIGVFQALQPALATSHGFLVGLAASSGLLSGLWLGRGFAMLRLTRAASAAPTMPIHGLADAARQVLRTEA